MELHVESVSSDDPNEGNLVRANVSKRIAADGNTGPLQSGAESRQRFRGKRTRSHTDMQRMGSRNEDSTQGKMPSKRTDGACWPRKLAQRAFASSHL